MKRIILAIILLATAFTPSYCQDQRKMSLQLSKLTTDPSVQSQQVTLLVQGDVEIIEKLTALQGGIFRYAVKNIAVITIPVSAITHFSSEEKIKRMESPANNYVAMNDSMRSVVRANEVHAGVPPLTQAYTGSGVVIGIIDTGVDLTHPDLQDSLGNTRIKHLWDQRKPVAANTPPAYGYGQEWNNTEIDAGLAVSSNDLQGFGHGTHVSGIAAGDGSANGKNKGVAPGADIIEVAFDFNNLTNATYVDAVNYIYSKAQLLGKPCVINASLGDYYGSHDGFDLQSQLVSAMINQQPGRVLVAAAGNAGSIPFHLGYNVTSDTTFTWVRHNPAYSSNFFQIWGDSADFKNINFSIGADVNATSASYRGRLAFRNIYYNLGVFKQDTLFSTSGNRLAIIQSFGSTQGSTYLLEFNVIPDSTNYEWRLITTGSGRFDMWKFYDGTGLPGYINSNLPAASVVPEIIYYKLPDANSTIVSGLQCLDNVITVGNYGNRNFYVDFNGNTYTDASVTPGQIVNNSSWGPTRDGRIKPDISAPGSITLSSGQLSLMAIWQNQPGNVPKIAEGGFHFRDGGTSSASPVVAGIAALFLEQNPGADAMQVKNALTQCALHDSFTGTNLPDNVWGHGKADALNTLINCALTSFNENPLSANNLLVYPNPVNSGDIVSVYFNNEESNIPKEIHLTDFTGKLISRTEVKDKSVKTISTKGLDAGIYILTLFEKGIKKRSGKISVIR